MQCVSLLLLCASSRVFARSASNTINSVASDDKYVYQTSTSEEVPKSASTGDSIWGDFDFVYRTYQDCSSGDLSVCLKLKLVSALDGAVRSMRNVDVVEGIKFVGLDKDDEFVSSSAMSENDILATLPRSVEGRESVLTSMIWDKLSSFFQTHTVQVRSIDTKSHYAPYYLKFHGMA